MISKIPSNSPVDLGTTNPASHTEKSFVDASLKT